MFSSRRHLLGLIPLAAALACGGESLVVPPTTGTLQVTTSTTGTDLDADGYIVTLDGSDHGAIQAAGTVSVEALTAGDHVAGLSGVAGNCQVQGDNPRTVAVPAGATATAAFTVVCTAPPANPGSILISTVTTGPNPDVDGYAFAVDAGTGQPIGPNATTTVGNLGEGAHSVTLSGVAGNCIVADTNPRPLTISAGATVDVSFSITCSAIASTGSIRVTTVTSGPDPDNNYSVSVDGGTAQNIGANSTITINGIGAGTRPVTLSGIAGNCEVEGDNPRSATVTAGTTAEVAFAVACAAPTIGPGSWALRARIPTVRQGLAGAVVQNATGQYIFYAIGGVGGTDEGNLARDQVEAYNAATNTWSGRALLPAARAWISASAIGGSIYVPGGADASGELTRTLYVYSPSANVWTTKAEMPVASFFNNTDVIAGKLYVLTGSCDVCDPLEQRLYRYDPATDAWERLADPVNNHSNGVMAAIDGKLYAAWGQTSTVDMYDPASNSWTHKLTMTEFGPVEDFGGLQAAAALNFNKKLYVIGGRSGDDAEKGTLAYDPVTNSWDFNKADMNFFRERPAVGKVKNAAGVLQIFVAGGLDTDPFVDLVTDSEAYTP